jgi:hypothetical protein
MTARRFAVLAMLLVGSIALDCPRLLAEERPSNPDAGVASPDAGDGPPSDAGETAQADAGKPVEILRITGNALVPESVVAQVVGALPEPGQDVHAWGVEAAQRIVDAYHERGYVYARAWFSENKEPGVLWFDVDEGRMRVSFVGMSSLTAALFRLRLNLPGGVFQKTELEKSLAEQKKAFNLVNAYYRVHELEGYEVTVFGDLVPSRTLEIHVVRRESFGWGLDISVSATWGVVPSLKYSDTNLFAAGFFHDLSVFEDRVASPPAVRFMNGFGPSLHFLILDQYVLGVYQGIGFAPGRFSQTISFGVQSVY